MIPSAQPVVSETNVTDTTFNIAGRPSPRGPGGTVVWPEGAVAVELGGSAAGVGVVDGTVGGDVVAVVADVPLVPFPDVHEARTSQAASSHVGPLHASLVTEASLPPTGAPAVRDFPHPDGRCPGANNFDGCPAGRLQQRVPAEPMA